MKKGAEREIEICKALIDMVNHDRAAQKMPARNIKIAFDEWNVYVPGLKASLPNRLYSDILAGMTRKRHRRMA